MSPAMTAALKALFDAARRARLNSYSPYSGHKIGAAIRVKGGQVFGGCNVENSSYGGTNCAERVAIQKAISELGQIEIEEILVITDAPNPWPPCGFCRQVIAEFAPASIPIHAANLAIDTPEFKMRSTTFGKLFPEAFTSDFLQK
ncbi:MAG: cytidine deaminase [Oligoflexia bacterium]|nr:cytidine deaminase [Oligoflexia bacterium]